MVPEDIRDRLDPFISQGVSWDAVNLNVGRLPRAELAPHAVIPRSVLFVTRRDDPGAAHALKTVAVTIGQDIFIDKAHADFNTASGLALLAHEKVHVNQNERIPNFAREYDKAARRTARDRPWENPFELEAYREEADVFCGLVAEGWAPGKWEPLGVTLWGC